MFNSRLLIILGMALVTYIPRLIPFIVLPKKQLPPKLDRFFYYLPFAFLGALIFPGILSSLSDFKAVAVASLVSLLLAWLNIKPVGVILGAVLSAYLFGLFWG